MYSNINIYLLNICATKRYRLSGSAYKNIRLSKEGEQKKLQVQLLKLFFLPRRAQMNTYLLMKIINLIFFIINDPNHKVQEPKINDENVKHDHVEGLYVAKLSCFFNPGIQEE